MQNYTYTAYLNSKRLEIIIENKLKERKLWEYGYIIYKKEVLHDILQHYIHILLIGINVEEQFHACAWASPEAVELEKWQCLEKEKGCILGKISARWINGGHI